MNTSVLYVGLDYHQNSVRVCAMNRQGEILLNRDVDSNWIAIRNAVRAKWSGPVYAAIEACCGAAAMADELVVRAGWSVDLAHPGYVSRMKQSMDKTDNIDGRVLADLSRVGYLPKVWLAPEPIRELRRLNSYRADLAKRRRNTKLRIGAMLRDQRVQSAARTRWSKPWRKWALETLGLSENGRWIVAQEMEELDRIEGKMVEVELLMLKQTTKDPLVRRLAEIKGIGLVTACYLRGAIGRFDRFRSGKQLARFCGLSPRNASSGACQADAGLISACDRTLRALLIEASHCLIRFDKRWNTFARHLRSQGKHTCVVAAAVANRWMRGLWHEMKPLGAGI